MIMHELARKHFERILSELRCVGAWEECPYYPCHQEHQDCTWCFCPFYPCEDECTGGKWKTTSQGTRIWDCSHCIWIHRSDVAARLMELLIRFGITSVDDLERELRKRDEMRAAMSDEESMTEEKNKNENKKENKNKNKKKEGENKCNLLLIFEILKEEMPPNTD